VKSYKKRRKSQKAVTKLLIVCLAVALAHKDNAIGGAQPHPTNSHLSASIDEIIKKYFRTREVFELDFRKRGGGY
jgi:hypothetical protein